MGHPRLSAPNPPRQTPPTTNHQHLKTETNTRTSAHPLPAHIPYTETSTQSTNPESTSRLCHRTTAIHNNRPPSHVKARPQTAKKTPFRSPSRRFRSFFVVQNLTDALKSRGGKRKITTAARHSRLTEKLFLYIFHTNNLLLGWHSSSLIGFNRAIFAVSNKQPLTLTRASSRIHDSTARGRAVVARRAHNPEVVGSNPTPATWSTSCDINNFILPNGAG